MILMAGEEQDELCDVTLAHGSVMVLVEKLRSELAEMFQIENLLMPDTQVMAA